MYVTSFFEIKTRIFPFHLIFLHDSKIFFFESLMTLYKVEVGSALYKEEGIRWTESMRVMGRTDIGSHTVFFWNTVSHSMVLHFKLAISLIILNQDS